MKIAVLRILSERSDTVQFSGRKNFTTVEHKVIPHVICLTKALYVYLSATIHRNVTQAIKHCSTSHLIRNQSQIIEVNRCCHFPLSNTSTWLSLSYGVFELNLLMRHGNSHEIHNIYYKYSAPEINLLMFFSSSSSSLFIALQGKIRYFGYFCDESMARRTPPCNRRLG